MAWETKSSTSGTFSAIMTGEFPSVSGLKRPPSGHSSASITTELPIEISACAIFPPATKRTSGSTLASTLGGLPSDRASKASTAWFSCSILFASLSRGFRERLGIGTLHSRPQGGERSKLQLLHRTLGLADLLRYFLNTFLLDEAQHHNPPLFHRQRLD